MGLYRDNESGICEIYRDQKKQKMFRECGNNINQSQFKIIWFF